MLTLIEGPETEAITLAEAKSHLRLWQDVTDDDAYISDLIVAAREFLESRTGRSVGVQTWQERRVVPTSGVIRLYKAPIASIESVEVDGEPINPLLKAGNRLDVGTSYVGQEVVVTYTAGWSVVPKRAKLAMLALILHWYDQREPVTDKATSTTPLHYEALEAGLTWTGGMPR